MPLTLETLPGRLLAPSVITTEAIINNKLECHDLSRRNRVFRVQIGDDAGFLVKQAGRENNHAGLQVEATALGMVRSRASFEPLRRWAPELVHFDKEDCLVVTRLLAPSTSLVKLHMNGGEAEFPLSAACTAGRMLAALHSVPRSEVLAEESMVPLQRGPIHNINRPFHYGWGYSREEFTPALLEVFNTIDQEIPELHETADALSATWPMVAPFHGDVRWDNFLVGPTEKRGPEGLMNMKLVDWEFFGLGDPAWDVASYLADYLRFWSTLTFPVEGRNPPQHRIYGDPPVMVPCGPAEFHASALEFLRTYEQHMEIDGETWTVMAARVRSYMPFAVLRIIVEQCGTQPAIAVGPRLLLGELTKWYHETDHMLETFFGWKGASA